MMCGIVVTKTGIFPLVATKSVSQILLNICYPCLLFSKIVPAFTPDNLHALGKLRSYAISNDLTIFKGPLVLVALLYQLTGAFLGLVAKQFFWVPHRFRYGIIVAGAFGNIGDLRKLHNLLVMSYRAVPHIWFQKNSHRCSFERYQFAAFQWDKGSKPVHRICFCHYIGLSRVSPVNFIRSAGEIVTPTGDTLSYGST